MNSNKPLILVTGATGYVGGRLVPRLLKAGYAVRVLVRDAQRLDGRSWQNSVEIVVGDVLQPASLTPAVAGVHAAYYMIHSMSDSENFEERDLIAARNFGQAAKTAGIEQIIYLSGLGSEEDELSDHLRSRHETGSALRESGVAVTEFRAAVIVGSGSISFEMVRNLTERLPVMLVPRWAATRIQPIAIRDVLFYLIAALQQPESQGQIIEIGGTTILTYAEMMKEYAAERELKRVLIPVPVLTPWLSSHWVHWMTPIPASISKPLIKGLRNEVIVRDETAKTLFPEITPLDYRTAVRLALTRLRNGRVESLWSDALSSSQGDKTPSAFRLEQGMLIERRERRVEASPEAVYKVFSGLGGQRGWFAYNWAWWLRGVLDRLVGGVGFRRGRRHPDDIRVGDALDFWRVELVQPDRLLRLRAEMKVPGRAWLQFEATPQENGQTELVQTAYFAPKGLSGLLYWYVLYPLHGLIFAELPRQIARRAEAQTGS